MPTKIHPEELLPVNGHILGFYPNGFKSLARNYLDCGINTTHMRNNGTSQANTYNWHNVELKFYGRKLANKHYNDN